MHLSPLRIQVCFSPLPKKCISLKYNERCCIYESCMVKSCYSCHPSERHVTLPTFGLSTDCWLRQDWKGKEDLDILTTSKLLNKISQRLFLEANWHGRACVRTAKLCHPSNHSGHIQNTCWRWSLTQVNTQAVLWHCLEEHKQAWAKAMPGTNLVVWTVSGPCLLGPV